MKPAAIGQCRPGLRRVPRHARGTLCRRRQLRGAARARRAATRTTASSAWSRSRRSSAKVTRSTSATTRGIFWIACDRAKNPTPTWRSATARRAWPSLANISLATESTLHWDPGAANHQHPRGQRSLALRVSQALDARGRIRIIAITRRTNVNVGGRQSHSPGRRAIGRPWPPAHLKQRIRKSRLRKRAAVLGLRCALIVEHQVP